MKYMISDITIFPYMEIINLKYSESQTYEYRAKVLL